MRLSHKLIVFMNWFGTGLLAPVLSLMLLSRGCTLPTLGAAIGVYSVTVIVSEVPTGVFADLYGRRHSFFLSCGAYLISFGLIFMTNNFILLLAAMIFQGIGRAFSSGSIDAFIIETAVEKHGSAGIARTVSNLSVLQSIGVASGAIIGGLLPGVYGYAFHIVIRIFLLLTVALLAFIFMKEHKKSPEHRITLKAHLTLSKTLIAAKKPLKYVIICITAASVMMFTIETYWQPAFMGIAQGYAQLFLGFLCAAGFAATALGSFIMGKFRLHTPKSRWIVYLIMLAGMSAAMLTLIFQNTIAGFMILYILWYLFLGGANVPEQTIINLAVPDKTRAAILSTASLSCQLGGVMSSLMCSLVIIGAGFRGIWLIGPALTIGAIIFILLRKKNLEITETSAPAC